MNKRSYYTLMRFHQFKKRHEIHLWCRWILKNIWDFQRYFFSSKEKGTIANGEKLIEETGPTLDLVQ